MAFSLVVGLKRLKGAYKTSHGLKDVAAEKPKALEPTAKDLPHLSVFKYFYKGFGVNDLYAVEMFYLKNMVVS